MITKRTNSSIMKVVVASKNPVKMNAAKTGFEACFQKEIELIGIHVESGVSDQPKSDEESLQGATNRTQDAIQFLKESDYYVGIEGGIHSDSDGLMAFAWIVVSDGTRYAKARTGSFYLPPEVARLIDEGLELGEADDRVFKQHNSKQKNGAVGLLTKNLITRETLYHQAMILALIPFQNASIYFHVNEKTEEMFFKKM